MKEKAIGFFDSGVGGLTVVREVIKQLPHEKIIYIGDSARAPYGPRPVDQVQAFSWQLTEFLLKFDVKMIVIACNTATAVSLSSIKEKLNIPVVGVITPGSRAAIKASSENKIAVLGTLGTIHSGEYEKALKARNPFVDVLPLACPKFVPIVESNEVNTPNSKKIVRESLKPLQWKQYDALILGCTHYPLLRNQIQQTVGHSVTLIDSGAETVSDVSMLLDYFELANSPSIEPKHEFYTTGSVAMFEQIANAWLGEEKRNIQHVNIGELKDEEK
ncbi:MAG: glutamate racemase [Streptococcaceae bacterium]|jgi:glutamate racemase|nr:glutamate racemase [Streptococcaceae bacterium]